MQWPQIYAVQHNDEEVRAESRSGGIFTAISDHVLDEGGIIYGCILTSNFQAVHIRVENKDERNFMRGSKYVQSRLGNILKQVEFDLVQSRKVLFSGTSCQIAGLLKYLEVRQVDHANLVCVDIVCHGVPSPKVWREYLEWQKSRYKAGITKVDFRNKVDFGWRAHVETLILDNGRKINSRIFTTLFYGHNILRPSCYECPYKSVMHPGDVTIADYWGIEKAAPEFDDNKGVSLVLINSDAGEELFEAVKDRIRWKKTRIEDSMQEPLRNPFPKPAKRDQFWKEFIKLDFEKVAKRYGGYGMVNKLNRGIIKVLQKLK